MILVDTSVWVDHLSRGVPALAELLEGGEVATHPFVIGELACGEVRNRAEVFGLLGRLPRAVVATDAEALELIERHKLMGRGLGWVDVHLLASARIGANPIWSRDKALLKAAAALKVRFDG